MAALSTLFYKLMPYAPGVSEPTAIRFMIDAARDFCRATWAVTSELPPITTSTAQFTLVDPTGLEIIDPVRVTCGGRTIWSRAEPAMDAVLGDMDYNYLTPASAPTSLLVVDAHTLQLIPAPSGPVTINVRAAVMPALNQENVPDDLVGRWHDAVVSGALARLLMQPGQQYTNQAAAANHAAVAGSVVVTARMKVNRSDSRNGTRVVGPSFLLGR